jgi:GTP-binding protein
VAGSEVVIGPREGGVIFDFEPTLTTGAELLTGPRGSDPRLDPSTRRTNAQRRRQYHEMMDAKAQAREELWMERQAGRWVDPGSGEPGEPGSAGAVGQSGGEIGQLGDDAGPAGAPS